MLFHIILGMIFRFSDNFEQYKMAACYQKGCLRLLVVLLSITVSTQQVYLQPSNTSNTECGDGGVIDGKDQVVMVGFVIADGTMPHTFEFFKSSVGDAFFFADCTISLHVYGCFSQSTSPCYCKEMSGNNYTVVYNRTANVRDSGATLRLSYQSLVSDQQLPIVYGAERVTVTIAGGGSSIPFSNICSQVFEPGKSYDFEICGENLKGAEFYIGTDAIVVSWKTTIHNCSSFLSVTLGTMMPLTFAYRETQGCLRHRSTSCTLTSSESEPACDDTCLIITVGVVVVVVIGGTILVLIMFWKKRLVCWEKTK